MTTGNQVDVGLSGSTGTGTFVGSTSPTLVTPTLGVATATSIAFSPTTDGIVGTTAADSAGTGYVGEYISSAVLYASRVSLSNGNPKDVTSITLSAGDWDVYGTVLISPTVNCNGCAAWINTSSATLPDNSLLSYFDVGTVNFGSIGTPVAMTRINVNGNQTVYLSAQASFSSGTCGASGLIEARRRR
jgi:hypothetical protein